MRGGGVGVLRKRGKWRVSARMIAGMIGRTSAVADRSDAPRVVFTTKTVKTVKRCRF
ncbi:hypothetical protein PT2222_230064 [Paraburkholderia tropica]